MRHPTPRIHPWLAALALLLSATSAPAATPPTPLQDLLTVADAIALHPYRTLHTALTPTPPLPTDATTWATLTTHLTTACTTAPPDLPTLTRALQTLEAQLGHPLAPSLFRTLESAHGLLLDRTAGTLRLHPHRTTMGLRALCELSRDTALLTTPERRALALDTLTELLQLSDQARRDLIREFAPPALVIGGGVSLGSYQAGFTDGLVRHLRQVDALRAQLHRTDWTTLAGDRSATAAWLFRAMDERGHFETTAGASAGSINALLASTFGCMDEAALGASVEASPFFTTWVDMGFDRRDTGTPPLFDESTIDGTHILSEATTIHLARRMGERLEQERAHWLPGCASSFGLTTTRLNPRQVQLAQGANVASIPRSTEKFLVRLSQGAASEPAVAISPITLDGDVSGIFLPVRPTWASLSEVVRASGAFPVAFRPIDLAPHLLTGQGTRDGDLFSDGGFLNNNPLDVIRLLEEAALQKAAQCSPNGPPDATCRATRNTRYLFVDQDYLPSRAPSRSRNLQPSETMLSNYKGLLAGGLDVATTQQLMSVVEREVDISTRLVVPIRRLASPSEFVAAMTGFLSREFRRLDFYNGLLDAYRFARETEPLAFLEALPAEQLPASPGLRCIASLRHHLETLPAQERRDPERWTTSALGTLSPDCAAFATDAGALQQREEPRRLVLLQLALTLLTDQRIEACGTPSTADTSDTPACHALHAIGALDAAWRATVARALAHADVLRPEYADPAAWAPADYISYGWDTLVDKLGASIRKVAFAHGLASGLFVPPVVDLALSGALGFPDRRRLTWRFSNWVSGSGSQLEFGLAGPSLSTASSEAWRLRPWVNVGVGTAFRLDDPGLVVPDGWRPELVAGGELSGPLAGDAFRVVATAGLGTALTLNRSGPQALDVFGDIQLGLRIGDVVDILIRAGLDARSLAPALLPSGSPYSIFNTGAPLSFGAAIGLRFDP